MPSWSPRRVLAMVPRSYQKLTFPLVLSCFLWLLLMESLYSNHSNDEHHHGNADGSSRLRDHNVRIGDAQSDRLIQRAFRKLAGAWNSTSDAVMNLKNNVFQKDVRTLSLDDVTMHTSSSSSSSKVEQKTTVTTNHRITKTNHKTTQAASLRPFEPILNLTAFNPVLTASEKDVLLDLASKLSEVTNKMNVTCFMYGGSLLGSYRHHDLIPWDDDIDVIANFRFKDRLYSALYHLGPRYDVFWAGPRLKFFSVDSAKTSKYPWKWPYVDIHFYKQNNTHIWDSAAEFRRYVYEKSYTFPLHLRPLGRISLNAPFDSFATLKATYPNTTTSCETHYYSHKRETNRQLKRYRIPCEMLKDKLAFVHRRSASSGVREDLMNDGVLLHSMIVGEPSYAVSKPYSLELW